MLAHASMPLKFWNEAFLSFVHIINRLPTPNLQYNTLFHILFGVPPTYGHFKIFGCACFPNLRPYNINKHQFRSTKCTYLGYSLDHKGY